MPTFPVSFAEILEDVNKSFWNGKATIHLKNEGLPQEGGENNPVGNPATSEENGGAGPPD